MVIPAGYRRAARAECQAMGDASPRLRTLLTLGASSCLGALAIATVVFSTPLPTALRGIHHNAARIGWTSCFEIPATLPLSLPITIAACVALLVAAFAVGRRLPSVPKNLLIALFSLSLLGSLWQRVSDERALRSDFEACERDSARERKEAMMMQERLNAGNLGRPARPASSAGPSCNCPPGDPLCSCL
jgi:hypothetical protein